MVDATGAGDSFDAGFLAAWLAGEPARRRARAGVRLRSAVDPLARRDGRPADAGRRRGRPSRDPVRRRQPVDRPPVHGRASSCRAASTGPAEFAQVPGGKGLNVARAATALGGDVSPPRSWAAMPADGSPSSSTGGRAARAPRGRRRDAIVALGGRRDRGADRVLRARAAGDGAEWAAFDELVAGLCPRGRVDDPLGLAAGRRTRGGIPAAGRLGPRRASNAVEPGIDAGPAIVKLNAAEAAHATASTRRTAAGARGGRRAPRRTGAPPW